jgi:hypothetical protein
MDVGILLNSELFPFLSSLLMFSRDVLLASYNFNYIHMLETLKFESLAKIPLPINYPMDTESALLYHPTFSCLKLSLVSNLLFLLFSISALSLRSYRPENPNHS